MEAWRAGDEALACHHHPPPATAQARLYEEGQVQHVGLDEEGAVVVAVPPLLPPLLPGRRRRGHLGHLAHREAFTTFLLSSSPPPADLVVLPEGEERLAPQPVGKQVAGLGRLPPQGDGGGRAGAQEQLDGQGRPGEGVRVILHSSWPPEVLRIGRVALGRGGRQLEGGGRRAPGG